MPDGRAQGPAGGLWARASPGGIRGDARRRDLLAPSPLHPDPSTISTEDRREDCPGRRTLKSYRALLYGKMPSKGPDSRVGERGSGPGR